MMMDTTMNVTIEYNNTMKKALITGINGSGATYLAEHLSTILNIQIQGISRWHTDRKNKSGVFSKVQMFECDLNDLGSVIRTLEVAQPDYIFHLASNANVKLSFSSPSSIFNNNVNGTLNLLEALRILNQKPMIQFCGTSEVYGQVKEDEIPIKETQSIDPVNVYAISKLTQEKLVKSYMRSYDIPCVITRAFGYINPRRPDIFSSAFAKQIVDIERGKQDILFHGNLDSVRTLLDVRDVVDAYWVAAEKCEIGEAYNIGSTVPVRVGDFLEELKKQANCKIISKEDPNLLRPVDVTLQIPSVDKFYEKTNWKPKYNIEDSVQLLLDYYRNQ
jgi:GDPmannose 4,6-dehydratase/GDP-4-dehydro-6-deoxy-D-mannose reductase